MGSGSGFFIMQQPSLFTPRSGKEIVRHDASTTTLAARSDKQKTQPLSHACASRIATMWALVHAGSMLRIAIGTNHSAAHGRRWCQQRQRQCSHCGPTHITPPPGHAALDELAKVDAGFTSRVVAAASEEHTRIVLSPTGSLTGDVDDVRKVGEAAGDGAAAAISPLASVPPGRALASDLSPLAFPPRNSTRAEDFTQSDAGRATKPAGENVVP